MGMDKMKRVFRVLSPMYAKRGGFKIAKAKDSGFYHCVGV